MVQTRKSNLQAVVANSQIGINLAIGLGRLVPPRLGYPLVRWIADRIAAQGDWAMVRAARLNQWIVSRQQLTAGELDRVVRENIRSHSRSLYDFYRYWKTPPEQQKLIHFRPEVEKLIQRSRQLDPQQGTVLVGIHLSNFDYAMYTTIHKGLRVLAITVNELSGGYQQQFNMRRSSGMEIMTASLSSFRLAVARLREGGVVLTGIDLPIPEPKYRPVFFGHPASLPVHYVQLALNAHVPIILAAVELQPDGSYHFLISDPLPMRPHPDRQTEILQNAEVVLSIAESFICKAPQQWGMFHPVWPELMDQVPS